MCQWISESISFKELWKTMLYEGLFRTLSKPPKVERRIWARSSNSLLSIDVNEYWCDFGYIQNSNGCDEFQGQKARKLTVESICLGPPVSKFMILHIGHIPKSKIDFLDNSISFFNLGEIIGRLVISKQLCIGLPPD